MDNTERMEKVGEGNFKRAISSALGILERQQGALVYRWGQTDIFGKNGGNALVRFFYPAPFNRSVPAHAEGFDIEMTVLHGTVQIIDVNIVPMAKGQEQIFQWSDKGMEPNIRCGTGQGKAWRLKEGDKLRIGSHDHYTFYSSGAVCLVTRIRQGDAPPNHLEMFGSLAQSPLMDEMPEEAMQELEKLTGELAQKGSAGEVAPEREDGMSHVQLPNFLASEGAPGPRNGDMASAPVEEGRLMHESEESNRLMHESEESNRLMHESGVLEEIRGALEEIRGMLAKSIAKSESIE